MKQILKKKFHGNERSFWKLFVITYISCIIGLGIIFILIEKNKLEDEIDQHLLFGSKVIQQILPKNFMESGTIDSTLSREEFLEMTERMSSTTEKLGFAYLYTLVKRSEDGVYLFSSMTLTKEEWAKEKDRYYYLYPYEDAPQAPLEKALKTMEPQFYEYKDQWGLFRSVFVPIKSESGQVYIAAADYDISKVRTLLLKRIAYISTVSLLLISALFPLLFYIRAVHRKNEVELEKRVQERTEQLQHANRLTELGKLAASIIHEIKNPLAIIMGYSSVGEENSEIAKIYNAAKRIDFVLNGLRSFSRNQKDLTQTHFNGHDSLQTIVSLWGPPIKKEKGIEIETHFRGTHNVLYGISQQFEQAILNFIINAKDAISEAQDQNKGLIKITTVNSSVTEFDIIIEDNGKGMSAEVLEMVSTPFYTTKDKEKGTGLGLYISKSIIEGMEGKLSIESQEGKGTKIMISLPCSQPHPKKDPV